MTDVLASCLAPDTPSVDRRVSASHRARGGTQDRACECFAPRTGDAPEDAFPSPCLHQGAPLYVR